MDAVVFNCPLRGNDRYREVKYVFLITIFTNKNTIAEMHLGRLFANGTQKKNAVDREKTTKNDRFF
jgi:hypothetical protein